MDFDKTESFMELERKKQNKGQREWECLTIGEMVEKKFSLRGAEFSHISVYMITINMNIDAHDALYTL